MQRTIRLKLHTTDAQKAGLLQTLTSFTHAFNFVCKYGCQHSQKNGVALHKTTYYTLRAMVELPSQLICAARVKATEALKSVFACKKAGRITSQPHSKLCPIRYDQRSYWVNWDTCHTSLATHGGRQVVGFEVPNYASRYTGYPVDSADLIYRKGDLWLHVAVTIPDIEFADNNQTIGIDLGLNHPAVTSDRKFLGSRHWKEVDRRNFRLKRGRKSPGTKSAKRHLKRLAGRQQRFRKDCDHVLSKRIVQSTNSGTTFVIENLTEILSRTRQRDCENKCRFHSWSFAQFRAFLTYKAEERGMRVVSIDPQHTSQTCSQCDYQHRSNRLSQSQFKCRAYDYSLNADLNASINIRARHLATLGISLGSGLLSTSPSCPATSVVEVQAVGFC